MLNRIQERLLIRNCILGKPSSQKKLYDIYSDEMFKVCISYAADYDSANDLLQEGFLKVFQNIHKYKQVGSFGGWIRTVIVHTCIDEYRKDKWNRNKQELNANNNHASKLFSINEVESKFEKDDFLKIINELPDGYKVVLNLYFLENYTHKEIAEKLGINEGTSKSQLFKAKRYLKELLINTLSEEELEQYGGLAKNVV
jgi:RNA polymerase sigma factor (sigma-70 family)